MITKEQIETYVAEKFEGTDKFLVELNIKAGNKIEVFIDADNGLTIDDCKMLSRHVEGSLDREVEDFELHVSSAGLDKPIKLLRQYKKNIGRKLTVNLLEGAPVTGKLLEVNENGIILEKELKKKKKKKGEPEIDPMLELKFDEIKEALVVISFK